MPIFIRIWALAILSIIQSQEIPAKQQLAWIILIAIFWFLPTEAIAHMSWI